jgi:sugar phosphate isomerase/epimerase
MRLAISNIAWDPPEDEAVAELLRTSGVDAIDVVPGKYFENPSAATDSEIGEVKDWWASRGIEILGMQALLFGTSGLNVFGDERSREGMIERLDAVCRIGGRLGARLLVFGSPRNRDRTGLDDTAAMAIAVPFFRRLGDIAQAHGVVVCLEPAPARYAGNFMVTSAETGRVVEETDHPAIRLQFDTGALAINGEDPERVLRDYSHVVGHVHASEPGLVPLGDGGADHGASARALLRHLPDRPVSIEMLATKQEPHLEAIARALQIAAANYGSQGIGAVA